jgi:hypothetical protein
MPRTAPPRLKSTQATRHAYTNQPRLRINTALQQPAGWQPSLLRPHLTDAPNRLTNTKSTTTDNKNGCIIHSMLLARNACMGCHTRTVRPTEYRPVEGVCVERCRAQHGHNKCVGGSLLQCMVVQTVCRAALGDGGGDAEKREGDAQMGNTRY